MIQSRECLTVPACPAFLARSRAAGFTLIELSVVLVIIGLIVGGVLVGQDLIKAAQLRAQITQTEQFNTAVNAFVAKCGGLPGDINAQGAAACGLQPRGQYQGEGDGNGLIEGAMNSGYCQFCLGGGETAVFWVDLSTAGLIDGSFSQAIDSGNSYVQPTAWVTPTSTSYHTIDAYMPVAKLGQGNYIYAYSENANNYFGMSALTAIPGVSAPSLTYPFRRSRHSALTRKSTTACRKLAESAHNI